MKNVEDQEIAAKLRGAADVAATNLMSIANSLKPEWDRQWSTLPIAVATMRPDLALLQAQRTLKSLVTMQLAMAEGNPIKQSQWEAAIDSSLGDILPMNMTQFEDFVAKGETKQLTDPTQKIVFAFRQNLLGVLYDNIEMAKA